MWLERGVVADTIETAAPWSRISTLLEAVRAAWAPFGAAAGADLSHVYPSGCSLYVTYLFAASQAEAAEKTRRAGAAVADAFLREAAPLSHQHGAGKAIAAAASLAMPPAVWAASPAVKRALDPTGILNPGAAFDTRPNGHLPLGDV